MLLQEVEVTTTPPPPPSLRDTIVDHVIRFLNYPFIQQEGQFKVSLMSLVLLAIVLFIAVLVSRYARRFLETRLLPRSHIDSGLRYTLLRVVHYLIITVGVIYGLKIGLAIDITSLAVILGFLSVGIGFGLQYIASDIVSGFILLFERPLRVGDRLKIDDIEGRVQSIRVRSSTLVTNDNITVIIPNSDLIRNKVINWSYSEYVRIRLPVGVAYGTDIELVKKALIEAGQSVEKVLKDPAPRVHFMRFGDSSLDFELLVYINLPHDHQQIRSNVNFEIDRLFRQYGIEIPFPIRDLNLRSGWDRLGVRPAPDAAREGQL